MYIIKVKPTEVKIINKSTNDTSLKFNQKHIIECQVYGSKPSAKVRWFKGSEEITNNSPPTIENSMEKRNNNNYIISELNRDISTNNLTKISYLTFTPQLSDNQQSLTCTAYNPKMPNAQSISDSMTMNVQCK